MHAGQSDGGAPVRRIPPPKYINLTAMISHHSWALRSLEKNESEMLPG